MARSNLFTVHFSKDVKCSTIIFYKLRAKKRLPNLCDSFFVNEISVLCIKLEHDVSYVYVMSTAL